MRASTTRATITAALPQQRQQAANAQAAMSFSTLNFSIAWLAQSTQSCAMSSDMSAFLMVACSAQRAGGRAGGRAWQQQR